MKTIEQKQKWANYISNYYKKNPEKRKEHDKKAYLKFKDKYKLNSRIWRQENPERYKELTRNRYKETPEANRGYRLKYEYGISIEDYNTLLQKQEFLCAVCKLEKKPLIVEHCHKTGKIRGLACHKCNIAIGFLEQKGMVKNITNYLQKSH